MSQSQSGKAGVAIAGAVVDNGSRLNAIGVRFAIRNSTKSAPTGTAINQRRIFSINNQAPRRPAA